MTWKTEDDLEGRSEKDMKNLDLQTKMEENQKEWRRRIHVDDH